jgi:hypothetical protein
MGGLCESVRYGPVSFATCPATIKLRPTIGVLGKRFHEYYSRELPEVPCGAGGGAAVGRRRRQGLDRVERVVVLRLTTVRPLRKSLIVKFGLAGF